MNIVYNNVVKRMCENLIPSQLFPPFPPPTTPLPFMMDNSEDVDALNDNDDLDFFTGYNRNYYDMYVNDDPYFGVQLSSQFYDSLTLSNAEFVKTSPIFLNINIQSLQSKYEQFLIEIADFSAKKIQIDIIALQEIWDVRYPKLLPIPGYKPLICKKRRGMRGGGVGFFIKDHLNAEILEEMSPFENKIIEALTIRLSYPNKKCIILTCLYRSNGILQNCTSSQQMERFNSKFSELLTKIQNTKMEAYIFTDSNIDLLKLNELNSMNFLNLILEKSFLPTIAKATRFQNLSKSLIDQILINKNCELIYSGTIISDLSDHFFTFIAPPGQRKNSHQNHRSVVARDYSLHNLNNFKQDLAVTDWGGVLSSNDVDESYAEFWNCYKTCHDANFPLNPPSTNGTFSSSKKIKFSPIFKV